MLSIEKIKKIATKHEWEFLAHQEENKMISFISNGQRINVYYSTGTVATCLNHPKKGKTQMFRRNVSIKQLETLFEKPRTHTTKGYRKKIDAPVVKNKKIEENILKLEKQIATLKKQHLKNKKPSMWQKFKLMIKRGGG
jgi:hypothetical protein